MIVRSILIITCLYISTIQAKVFKRRYPSHMSPQYTCKKDSKLNRKYCLELIEFKYKSTIPKRAVALLISGFFQNAYIWDLRPRQNISLAKYMMENYGIHPYVLHVRGVGNSHYLKNTNLDDIAIDDIPIALEYLHNKEKQKIILIGHSQGAITSLASMSGLTRCGKNNNCFKPSVAKKRQSIVRRIGLLAGNSAMTIDRDDNFLNKLLPLGRSRSIQKLLRWVDKIDVNVATKLTGPLAFIRVWENLYVLENVSMASRKALWKKTVDTTSGQIIIQFTNALLNKDLLSVGGHSYSNNAKNVLIPTIQQTYEYDELAEPYPTLNDTFSKIGSENKEFSLVYNCAHEDFFMEKELHSWVDPVFKFLLK